MVEYPLGVRGVGGSKNPFAPELLSACRCARRVLATARTSERSRGKRNQGFRSETFTENERKSKRVLKIPLGPYTKKGFALLSWLSSHKGVAPLLKPCAVEERNIKRLSSIMKRVRTLEQWETFVSLRFGPVVEWLRRHPDITLFRRVEKALTEMVLER